MAEDLRSIHTLKVVGRRAEAGEDVAAVEEPLEIRLGQRPFSVIMRTPGADRELAAGFLFSEQVVRGADDLGAVQDGRPNIINVDLAGEPAARLDDIVGGRRNVATTSSCGLCGRVTIESLRVDAPAIAATWTASADLVASLPERVRTRQRVFDETGGLHAAGLFHRDGTLVEIAEDVGRHNAVDKIVGRLLMARRLPASDHILFVSGRTSFEIVQKAFLAGIPIVAAVSAPSTLAIDLAQEAGMTLLGFVRGDRFNIYSHPQRIALQ